MDHIESAPLTNQTSVTGQMDKAQKHWAVKMLTRFGAAEMMSTVGGVGAGIVFFDLARRGILHPALAGIVLYTAETFTFYATDYLVRLRDQTLGDAGKGSRMQLLNPMQYVIGITHPDTKVKITTEDRINTIKEMVRDYGPSEFIDMATRLTLYTGSGASLDKNNPLHALVQYIGGLKGYIGGKYISDAIFYTWPTIRTYFKARREAKAKLEKLHKVEKNFI